MKKLLLFSTGILFVVIFLITKLTPLEIILSISTFILLFSSFFIHEELKKEGLLEKRLLIYTFFALQIFTLTISTTAVIVHVSINPRIACDLFIFLNLLYSFCSMYIAETWTKRLINYKAH